LQDDLLAFAQYVQYGHYQRAPHLRELSKALESIDSTPESRIIVTWPPRHGKTLLTSIFLAWYLGRNPRKSVIVGCYTSTLAVKTSRRVRNIIKSDRFRNVFPGVELASDSQAVDAWELEGHGGGLRAIGVGGSVTGTGADLLVIDDPVKGRAEAESQTIRDKTWSWYQADVYTRLEPGGSVVVIQTRWHEDDLTGRLLEAVKTDPEADRWAQLHRPAIDEEGNALWTERYPVKRLKAIQANVGPYEWESLYQGRPSPPGGGFLKREWFRTVDGCSGGRVRVRYWDLATSEKTSADYTASFCMTMTREGDVFFDAPVHVQMEWPQARELIAQTAIAEPGVIVGVEKTGFQAAGVQELLQDPRLANTAIVPVVSDKDKLTRALPFQARAAAGKCYLVQGQWVEGALLEWSQFPLGKHDVLVDAASGGFAMLAEYQTPMRIYSLDEDGAPEGNDTEDAEDDPIWDS